MIKGAKYLLTLISLYKRMIERFGDFYEKENRINDDGINDDAWNGSLWFRRQK